MTQGRQRVVGQKCTEKDRTCMKRYWPRVLSGETLGPAGELASLKLEAR